MYKPGRRKRPTQRKCCDSNLNSGSASHVSTSGHNRPTASQKFFAGQLIECFNLIPVRPAAAFAVRLSEEC